jgi:hypothetical protein
MTTPQYKGPGQPSPGATNGVTGWFGGCLGGTPAPAYKTAPVVALATTAVASALPCPPCKPSSEPTTLFALVQDKNGCDAEPAPTALDEYADAVVPVGPGPITIVINPRD